MQTAAIYWTRYKRRRVREKPEPESSYGPVGARTALEIARACEPTLELEIVCPGNKVSFCKARQNRERACATLKHTRQTCQARLQVRPSDVLGEYLVSATVPMTGPRTTIVDRDPRPESRRKWISDMVALNRHRPCGQSATQIIGGGKHRNLMVGVDCVTGPHSQACEYARPDKIILIAVASVFNRAMDFFFGESESCDGNRR